MDHKTEKNVTLWTRQVSQVWDALTSDGTYHVKEEYIRQKNGSISDYYLNLYSWYTNAAKKYVDIPPHLKYPIWLSITDEMMLQPVENTVILKLSVPSEKVVFANMDAWGYVVNHWYVPKDEEDAKAHEKELHMHGIKEEDSLISTSAGNFYPLLKRKILSSWERVFTLPTENETSTVATLWEIKKEWIV